MGIEKRLFRSLLPPSWRLGRDFGAVIDALALSFGRVRAFLRELEAENNPLTSVYDLPEWYADLGLIYDESLPLAERQTRVSQSFSDAGGQSLAALEAKVRVAYPDVSLKETVIRHDLTHVGSAMVGQMMVTDYPGWVWPKPSGGDHHGFFYRVTGQMESPEDLPGLKRLLQKIMPAAYEPVFDITFRRVSR